MAINLATKYSQKVAERFSLKSLTDSYVGKDYEFNGVKGIKIYSIDTVPLVDYTRSGTNRFGDMTELGDTIQEMIMTKDVAFQFSIDKGNAAQQFNIKQATKSLKRQIDEVVTREIDQYRLEQWALNAGTIEAVGALTKANIIEKILTASKKVNNLLVPKDNRAIFITESEFLKCKLADQIIGVDKLATDSIVRGSVGTLDRMHVIPVPDSYMDGVLFLIKYKNCSVDPVQLKTYRVLKDHPGIDGDVVQGRVIFDSFVIDARKNGIYAATE